MSAPFPSFELARKVADAVLYEGYLLYPYRASAAKNQARWQFGVLMPRLWSEAGPDEPWSTQTECLLEPEDATTVRVPSVAKGPSGRNTNSPGVKSRYGGST